MFTSESKEEKISPKWTEVAYYNDSLRLCKHLFITKIPRYLYSVLCLIKFFTKMIIWDKYNNIINWLFMNKVRISTPNRLELWNMAKIILF